MTRRSKRQATDTERKQIEHAVLSVVLTNGEAGTDEAHAQFELPEAVEPRIWGAITGGLLVKGLIRRVGETHTRRSAAHGRRIGVYAVTDAVQARKRRDVLAASAARKRLAQQTLFDREG